MSNLKSVVSEWSVSQRYIILFGMLINSFNCMAYMSSSIYFSKPQMMCQTSSHGHIQECSYKQACFQSYYYYMLPSSAQNYTTKFKLICQNSWKKRFCMSIIFSGGFVGSIMTMYLKISKKNRLIFIALIALISSCCLVGVLVIHNLYLISILLGIAFNMNLTIVGNHLIIFFSEIMNQKQQAISITMCNMLWGICGMIVSFICYLLNGNVNQILFIMAICLSICSLGLYYQIFNFKPSQYQNLTECCSKLDDEKNDDQDELQILEFKDRIDQWIYFMKHPAILLNLIILTAEYVTYYGCLVLANMSVENLNGNMYLNLGLLSLAELLGSYAASYLINTVGSYRAQRHSVFYLTVLLHLFIFCPIEKEKQSPFHSQFFFIINILIKLLTECSCNLCCGQIAQHFPNPILHLVCGIYSFFSRLGLLFQPQFQYFMTNSLHINPQVAAGIITLIIWILLPYYTKIKEYKKFNIEYQTQIRKLDKIS